MSEIKNWYKSLNQREAFMVRLLAIALGLLLISMLIVLPIKKYRAGLSSEAEQLSKQVITLKKQVATLKAGGASSVSNQPLNQMINQTASKFGLKLSNIQERKRNQEIQLRLDDAEFDKLIRWVASLENNNGLIIDTFRVSKTDATGKVDVSLKVLKAG